MWFTWSRIIFRITGFFHDFSPCLAVFPAHFGPFKKKFWHDGIKPSVGAPKLFVYPPCYGTYRARIVYGCLLGCSTVSDLIALRGLNWPNSLYIYIYILGLWDKSGSIWETHAVMIWLTIPGWWVGRNWIVPEVRKFSEYTLPKFNMEPQNGPKHDSTGYGHCWLPLEFRGAYHPVQLVFDFCAVQTSSSTDQKASFAQWSWLGVAALVLPSGNLT